MLKCERSRNRRYGPGRIQTRTVVERRLGAVRSDRRKPDNRTGPPRRLFWCGASAEGAMSTFVPSGFTPFQSALARLGPSGAEEFRRALYAGTVRACLMDDHEVPLPPDWWACDRSWNEAVATGRGSVSTGALYFETVSRGPILVRSNDVERLLASHQGNENTAAPSSDAAAGPHPTALEQGVPAARWHDGPPQGDILEPSSGSALDLQPRWGGVRRTSALSLGGVDDAILSGIREADSRDADFFLISFESAEQETINKLSGGKLEPSDARMVRVFARRSQLKNGLVLNSTIMD